MAKQKKKSPVEKKIPSGNTQEKNLKAGCQNKDSGEVRPRWLRGGVTGLALVASFVLVGIGTMYEYYVGPHYSRSYGKELKFESAMFEEGIPQPIPFSHRLHATDKNIDCHYCHSYVERSMNSGMPSVTKCLGCHNHIIPEHEEIRKLRSYQEQGKNLPWTRVYYNPDHVFFPHYRHRKKGVECEECHGEVAKVDRLKKSTFYMGFCIGCHKERGASLECVGCHQ